MLEGSWINIVGARPDTYQELAFHLETSTGSRCHIADCRTDQSPTLKYNAKTGLVLIDAMEDKPGEALDLLMECRK